jgi:hypothetical protein
VNAPPLTVLRKLLSLDSNRLTRVYKPEEGCFTRWLSMLKLTSPFLSSVHFSRDELAYSAYVRISSSPMSAMIFSTTTVESNLIVLTHSTTFSMLLKRLIRGSSSVLDLRKFDLWSPYTGLTWILNPHRLSECSLRAYPLGWNSAWMVFPSNRIGRRILGLPETR